MPNLSSYFSSAGFTGQVTDTDQLFHHRLRKYDLTFKLRLTIKLYNISLNLLTQQMAESLLSPNSEQEAAKAFIKPLKPLVYNFFISDKPQTFSETLDNIDMSDYRSFHSQRLDIKNSYYFKPTIQFKKMIEEPKFLLSVERKKIKVMNGVTQRANSERPSRNSYRGSKIKTQTKTINNIEEQQFQEKYPKQKRIQSRQLSYRNSPRKSKQPHLNFNLRHILQTRKHFSGQFLRQENIQGSNFPYYNYFSSEKSSVPMSQKSARDRQLIKTTEKHRYISTTMGVRTNHNLNQN